MTQLDATKALELAKAAYQDSTTYFDASIRKSVEAGLRQFQGVHAAGSKYHSDAYRSRSKFFRPKTRGTIRRNEAVAAEAFFTTNTMVNVDPDDDGDDKQRASAALRGQLMNYRLKKTIPWFLVSMGAYQDAQVVGVAISHQWWEYDPKRKIDRPRIDLIPVENLRLSAGCDWIDPIGTSPFLIHKIPMYVKDVRAKMTDAGDKAGKATWRPIEDAKLLVAINAYSDSTRLTRERGRQDSKEAASEVTDYQLVWVHRHIHEWEGVDHVWYTLGDVELLSNPVPLETVCRIGCRPYVMGYCIIETHKTYPDGVAGLTRDTQAEINDLANLRVDNVKFALNKRYFGKRGQQIDLRSLTRNVPGSITMMNDPEKDVKEIEFRDVTSSSYEEQDRLNNDFDELAGSFSASSVQSNRQLNDTVGGMKLLNATTNQVGAYQLRTFVETWAVPVLRQLDLLEQAYETDETILRLAGMRAKLDTEHGIEAVTDDLLGVEADMNISLSGVGNVSPQEQINNFIRAMSALRDLLADGILEKYGLDVHEVVAELFGRLGHKDGKRFFNTGNQDPRLFAAMRTIEQLQQELAQKVSPEMVAKQIEKLDAEIVNLGAKNRDVLATALEKTVRSIFAASQTAQVITSVPATASVTDRILIEAGWTPPAGAHIPIPGPGSNAGETQGKIKDPRTGIEFTPGGAGAAAGDTSPDTPVTPGAGAEQGIETARVD